MKLDKHPDYDDVIPGGDGLRKIRLALSEQSKGSRGGARVIYYVVVDKDVVLFVDIYAKNEKENLTKDELGLLVATKEEFVAKIRKNKHA